MTQISDQQNVAKREESPQEKELKSKFATLLLKQVQSEILARKQRPLKAAQKGLA